MAEARTPLESPGAIEVDPLNVADRLALWATQTPTEIAVAEFRRSNRWLEIRREPHVHHHGWFIGRSGAHYNEISFFDLDDQANVLARGLVRWGVTPGTRIALLVRPGILFVELVFALMRAGAVIVFVDSGMGRRQLVQCLADAQVEGFIGIPIAHALRLVFRHKFPRAKWNVTVGRPQFWGCMSFGELANRGYIQSDPGLPVTRGDDPAAIIFTSGSTGPAKGVLYTHRMFDTQVSEIQSTYGIQPGGVDLSCFPLFALFNSAMGVTTVLPDMDFSRPAAADPRKLLAAANDWRVSQAFASPAVWRKLSDHCGQSGEHIESLRQVFSCGAPVPAAVLRSTLTHVSPNAQMHTPYGATECLPVATIEASEVLGETAEKTDQGAGICVGRPFGTIDWKVIRITDEPITSIDEDEELPPGEIGELIVRGPQASPVYVTRTECNADSKIQDATENDAAPATEYKVLSTKYEVQKLRPAPESPVPSPPFGRELRAERQPPTPAWHRMGDVGYLDNQGRFWYCGRKSHRVERVEGALFTECIEAMFNHVPFVQRFALVGVGAIGKQTPVIIYETSLPRTIYPDPSVPNAPHTPEQFAALIPDMLGQIANKNPQTASISHFLRHDRFPVDVRHNAKINREALADWAAKMLPELC